MNLAELFRHETDLVTVAAGQPIFRSGDAATVMYVLMQGNVEVLVGDVVVETAVTGALLGEMAMIDHAERNATVIARDECRLLPIDIRRFDFLIQQTPYFARHVMKVMADRLRRMDSMFLEIQSGRKT